MRSQGSGHYKIELVLTSSKVLHARSSNSRVVQFQISGHLRQERSLLAIGFDQSDLQRRDSDPQRQPGKSGSRTDVGEPTIANRNNSGGEKALAKMKPNDLFLVRDRSQRNVIVPSKKK